METAPVSERNAPGIPAPPAKVVTVADPVASAVDNVVPTSDEPRPRQPTGE
jgi:hypothetical protein